LKRRAGDLLDAHSIHLEHGQHRALALSGTGYSLGGHNGVAYFDEIISVDGLERTKPSLRVYALRSKS